MRKPPTSGPNATAAPATVPHAANAIARSAPTNVVDRIESVAGISSDAPMPSMIASPSTSVGNRVRHRREQRTDAEDHRADDEHAAVAVHVAEPAADDQERRERQRVAGDDPLEAREVGVELAQDRRNRDVQDGVVEHRDGDRHDHDRGREPASRVGCGGSEIGGSSAIARYICIRKIREPDPTDADCAENPLASGPRRSLTRSAGDAEPDDQHSEAIDDR